MPKVINMTQTPETAPEPLTKNMFFMRDGDIFVTVATDSCSLYLIGLTSMNRWTAENLEGKTVQDLLRSDYMHRIHVDSITLK